MKVEHFPLSLLPAPIISTTLLFFYADISSFSLTSISSFWSPSLNSRVERKVNTYPCEHEYAHYAVKLLTCTPEYDQMRATDRQL